MIDTNIILKQKVFTQDSIGNEVETITSVNVPIIRKENIFSTEFYRAAQVGYKPTLSVVISALNYNGENELTYMNKDYTIIRVDERNLDELALMCQIKINEY